MAAIGDRSAYPTSLSADGPFGGMTIRQHMALEILAGLGTWVPGTKMLAVAGDPNPEALAARSAFAVAQADALLSELERTR